MSGQLLRCTSFSSSRSPILAIRTPLWLLYLCFVLVCNFNPSGIAVIAKNYLKLHDCIDCKQSLSFPSVFLAFLFGGFREQKPTTRRLLNGVRMAFKIGTRGKFATHLRTLWGRKTLFTQLFLRSVIFPYNSLYTQVVAYTTYFELGEPVRGTGT